MTKDTMTDADALQAKLPPPYRKLLPEGSKPALPNMCHLFFKKVSAYQDFFLETRTMIAKPEQNERQRWDITPEIRNQVVSKLMEIVTGDNAAQSIRAARLLMEIDQLNVNASSIAAEIESDMRLQIQKVLRQRGEG